MSIWIAAFAAFVSLLVIAVSMMGFFFLLTKTVEKSETSSDTDENEDNGKNDTMRF